MINQVKNLSTPEERHAYSKAVVKKALKKVFESKTNHLSGNYRSKKIDKKINFKSTWELVVMMWWDTRDDIVSYERECQSIQLNDGRQAHPNFRITYSNKTIKMIELVPTSVQNLRSVKEKLKLVKETIHDSGNEYELLGDCEIKLMIKDLGEVLKNEVQRHKNWE